LAFDLKAVIRLVDNFSAPLKRMQRQTEQFQRTTERVRRSTELWRDASGRLRDSMGRFAKETERASWNLTNLGNGLRNVAKEASGIRGLAGAFTGLATAIGGAYTAKKIFDSTVWEAAKFENSQVVIRAMFDDRKVADEYMKMLERFAIDSPVLNSQDMFENSKSFITKTKDIKLLEKMWDLTERLVAIDPLQGVEGAVYALNEFFGGDLVSLKDRFELDVKPLKEFTKAPIEKKLEVLDKYFTKMGATQKLVNEMGNTTIGLWNRVREQFAVILREMGKPSLEVLSGFLTKVLQKLESGDFSRFAQIGARMIKSILTGLTNGIMAIYNWFDTVTKSEEFQKRTTLSGKVKFIIEDLYKRFMNWLNSKGMKQIESVTSTLIGALSSAIERNAGPIAKAAFSVGSKIGSAIAKGIMDAISKNPIAKWVISGGSIAGIAYDKIRGLLDGGEKSKKRKSSSTRYYNPRLIKGYYHGLSYVPYDRFPALLHKGEMVLTRKEANEYRKGQAGGAKSVVIKVNSLVVREEADIRKIAHQLADLLAEAGANGA
jgi:hypothetical protein